MRVEKGIILCNTQIAMDTYKMELQGNLVKTAKPGQFINILIDGFMLRRPISICSIDEHSITIIYKVVGDGTESLAQMKVQDELDIFGPLGHGFPIEEQQEAVLLIGGGAGVPPLYEVAKQYCALGKRVEVVLGFQDQASIFFEQEFHALKANVYIATMDGSYGIKGTVMDAITTNGILGEVVYACGPLAMLKAVEGNYTKGYMSFESRMACGMGACMACVANDKNDEERYHRICKEGPVFPIGKVKF